MFLIGLVYTFKIAIFWGRVYNLTTVLLQFFQSKQSGRFLKLYLLLKP